MPNGRGWAYATGATPVGWAYATGATTGAAPPRGAAPSPEYTGFEGYLSAEAAALYGLLVSFGWSPTQAFSFAMGLDTGEIPMQVAEDTVAQLEKQFYEKRPELLKPKISPREKEARLRDVIETHPEVATLAPEKQEFLSSLMPDASGNVYDRYGYPIPLDFIIEQVKAVDFTPYQLGQWAEPEVRERIDSVTGEQSYTWLYPLPFTQYYRQMQYYKTYPEAYEPIGRLEGLKPTREKPFGVKPGPMPISAEAYEAQGALQKRKREEERAKRETEARFRELSQRAQRVVRI